MASLMTFSFCEEIKFDRLVKNPSAVLRCALARFLPGQAYCAAYFFIRLIPQDLRALHLKFFTVPSHLLTFYEFINVGFQNLISIETIWTINY
jgi:hypothetical protein